MGSGFFCYELFSRRGLNLFAHWNVEAKICCWDSVELN